jgi:tetratricopeptide (TPR) repeat protein
MGLHTDIEAKIGSSAEARRRCQDARRLEDAGKYDEAREALGSLWQRVGERPDLEGLDECARGEVLLRSGVLSGWIGSARQVEGAQETAKDLISESISLFESLGLRSLVIEARYNLARCYMREGAFDDARAILSNLQNEIPANETELRARAFLVAVRTERAAGRLRDSFRLHLDAESIFQRCANHTLVGSYHNEFGITLKDLGAAEQRADFLDLALEQFAAASHHFEKAGHAHYRARVENNVGLLLVKVARYQEARERFQGARSLAENVGDKNLIAIIDESRATGLLAEGRNKEALRIIKASVWTLEAGGESGLLAESLRTQGVALARSEDFAQAHESFSRAVDAAALVGDKEGVGLGWLTMFEELVSHLSDEQKIESFISASNLLADSQDPTTSRRLLICGRLLIHQMVNAKKKQAVNWQGFSLRNALLEHEAFYIQQAMRATGGNVKQAAKLLGISHQLLFSKLSTKHADLKALQASPAKLSIVKEQAASCASVALMPGTLQLQLLPGITPNDLLSTHLMTSFALKELKVYPDDLIVVRVGGVEAGELVGALVEHEGYAVGKVRFEDSKVILSMDNSEVEPLEFDKEAIEIEGRIIGYCKAEEVRAHREATRRKQGGLLKVYPI